MAGAAITGGKVRVENLNPRSSQGDMSFLDVLEKMGCGVKSGKDFVEVLGGELNGIAVSLGDCPDVVPTLAIVAAFAEGKTMIRGIAHLAGKESNRIESVAKNLQACGVRAKAGKDSLEIIGGKPHGAEINPFGDHRIAMAFSVMGLAVPGIIISTPEVVSKSYPGFFEELRKAYGDSE